MFGKSTFGIFFGKLIGQSFDNSFYNSFVKLFNTSFSIFPIHRWIWEFIKWLLRKFLWLIHPKFHRKFVWKFIRQFIWEFFDNPAVNAFENLFATILRILSKIFFFFWKFHRQMFWKLWKNSVDITLIIESTTPLNIVLKNLTVYFSHENCLGLNSKSFEIVFDNSF